MSKASDLENHGLLDKEGSTLKASFKFSVFKISERDDAAMH